MIFTDTITHYHHTEDGWERNVINNVMVRPKTEKIIDSNGVLHISEYLSITIPFDGSKRRFGTENKDLIVMGICEETCNEYSFRDIANCECGATIQSVKDNTNRDHLPHWKVIAQ